MGPKGLAKADLARSGISWAEAEQAGMFVVSDASALHSSFHSVPAMVIPYPDPQTGDVMDDGHGGPFYRLRYLEQPKAKKGFRKRKAPRYVQPPDSEVRAYFPPVDGVDWQALQADHKEPLIIVEGEKKALASTLEGYPAIGLGGVYSFTHLPGQLLPELEQVRWRKRIVYIIYDSDIADNADVQAAEGRLTVLLSQSYGAIVKPIRLSDAGDGEKVGLDDFLVDQGEQALRKLLRAAAPLGKADLAVASLNEHISWIESENMVYDHDTKQFLRKESLVNGSKYSALTYFSPSQKGKSAKKVSVPSMWLTHPHASRYDDIVFAPGRSDSVLEREDGGWALNMWTGLDSHAGDPSPWLDLSRFLFKDLPPELQELPIKLMAYKAQNPDVKIPLALVFVGLQGSGKSLWADILAEAFTPYSATISSATLGLDYNGFVEHTLLTCIQEAEPEHLRRHGGTLRSLISDMRQSMNEKYRPAKQVNSYTFYIVTSNKHGVAAYSQDDRRMFVIGTPEKRERAFYEPMFPTSSWRRRGGAKAVLHYLLTYDLEGWQPPSQAPMTADKYMAYVENLSPAERLAEETNTADENVVALWIQQSLTWAETAETSNDPQQAKLAREIVDSMSVMQIRPFYSPEELALMFPAITSSLHGTRKGGTTVAGELSQGLRNAGVRYLRCSDDPRGFRWKGMIRQYLVIAEADQWMDPISQAEFEQLMQQFPRFREYVKQKQQSSYGE